VKVQDAPIADKPRVRAKAILPLPRPRPRARFGSRSLLQTIGESFGAAVTEAIDERRAFVLAPFTLIAGLIAYRVLPDEPDIAILVLGAILAALSVIVWRNSHAGLRVASLAAVAWVGFCALPVHGLLFGTPMLSAPAYGFYTARIDRVIFDDGETKRWVVSDIASDRDWNAIDVRRARIAANLDASVRPGDLIHARIRFYPVPAPIVIGGHDAQFVSYFQGIGAYGTLLGDLTITPTDTGSFARAVSDLRAEIGQRVLRTLDSRIGGIAIALITGDQSRLLEADRETMATVGLAHVLAISGLHLSLVAGTMYVILRYGLALSHSLAQRWPIKKIAAVGGIATAIAYMIVSGMGVPAVRSTIMLVLVFAAVIAGRQALTMRNVALAGLALALIDPASVFRASFQLSFAAVVALIAAFELARARREATLKPKNKFLALFFDIAVTSLIAGAATLLFTAFYFQQTAPFGVVGNLVAMPIVTFLMMPIALFGMLAMPLGLEAPFFTLMGWSIEAVLWLAHMVGVMSGGFDPSPLLARSSLVVGLVAIAWLAFFPGRLRLLGPLCAIPIIAIFCLDQRPDILIADGTQALAVRHDGQLGLIAGRNNTFATTIWTERYMEPMQSSHPGTRCDGLGCFIETSHGYSVALARHPAAFDEDCGRADLVIARMDVPSWCPAISTTVSATDLARGGAQFLYWRGEGRGFEHRTAIDDPDRPWRSGHRSD
jgi:competence protein ComEC